MTDSKTCEAALGRARGDGDGEEGSDQEECRENGKDERYKEVECREYSVEDKEEEEDDIRRNSPLPRCASQHLRCILQLSAARPGQQSTCS